MSDLKPSERADWDYRVVASSRLYYAVGPGAKNERTKGRSLEQYAVDAAWMLSSDGGRQTIHWQPGDGSNLVVSTVYLNERNWLAAVTVPTTCGLIALPGPGGRRIDVDDWVRSSMPEGYWGTAYPLLAAMGHVRESGAYRPSIFSQKMSEEAGERARQYRTQYVNDKDAELGRQVRLLVNSANPQN